MEAAIPNTSHCTVHKKNCEIEYGSESILFNFTWCWPTTSERIKKPAIARIFDVST
jgi:hypothetical protein